MNLQTPCGDIKIVGELQKHIYLVSDLNIKSHKFNFSNNLQRMFSEGDCGDLALALNSKIGWDVYSIFWSKSRDKTGARLFPAHYVVKAHGDMYMDITGISTKKELTSAWLKRASRYIDPRDFEILPTNMKTMDDPSFECDPEDQNTLDDTVNNIIEIISKRYNVLKVFTYNRHPFVSSGVDIFSSYPTKTSLLRRVACNYVIMGNLGFGPKSEVKVCDNGVLVIMEYLPILSTNKLIKENSNKIQNMIKKMHNLGIYHGNLNGSNIAFNSEMSPKVIDLETLFLFEEINTTAITEWAAKGFDMTVNELIKHELDRGWKRVIDK